MSEYYIKATATMPVHLRYHCSKCGKMNDNVCTLKEHAFVKDDTFFFSPKREVLKKEARSQALNAMSQRLQAIFSANSEERYDIAKLNCKCSRCGHKEPWARLRISEADFLIRDITCFLGRALTIVFIVGLFVPVAFVLFAFGLAWVLLFRQFWTHLKGFYTQRMHQKIRMLPEESMPTISYDDRDMGISH